MSGNLRMNQPNSYFSCPIQYPNHHPPISLYGADLGIQPYQSQTFSQSNDLINVKMSRIISESPQSCGRILKVERTSPGDHNCFEKKVTQRNSMQETQKF